jgi:GSH-dependent disulfide-bond oxidoreductase
MIDLYTWTTPNGRKISIMLEEVGLPYAVHALDFEKGEQRGAAYLAVNPNGKVPAIVDRDGPGGAPLTLFESGAILVYLAEKSGRLLAPTGAARALALQWLMFQTGNVGPTFHDGYYFMAQAPERLPHAIEYFSTEIGRVLGVLDAHLAAHEFLAPEYSIADVAVYPWVAAAVGANLPGFDRFTGLRRWFDALSARPAVARGMAIPA